jgi:hypothetical protein
MPVPPPSQPTDEEKDEGAEEEDADEIDRPGLKHTSTIDSTLSESRFAVLPHGQNLEGWTAGEKDELNNHVRHMLHSKRSKFKRGMKGFGQYVKQREYSNEHPNTIDRTTLTNHRSSGVLRHAIRDINNFIWPGLGLILNRYAPPSLH